MWYALAFAAGALFAVLALFAAGILMERRGRRGQALTITAAGC